MDLELGAQTRAARVVAEAVPEVMSPVDSLARAVPTDAAGLRGSAAAGLGQALQAWFEVAGGLPDILCGCAEDLVAASASVDGVRVRVLESDGRSARVQVDTTDVDVAPIAVG